MEVGEITLSNACNWPRFEISSSVAPSEKNSWFGSPERFRKGRTAMDRICEERGCGQNLHAAAAMIRNRAAAAIHIHNLLTGARADGVDSAVDRDRRRKSTTSSRMDW